jgi:calcium/calmodulin-dependent protein kinase I
LLPEIKAYMAKARLRRGIELVKLSNRIEALKIQEDDPENPDFPDNAAVAAKEAQEAHLSAAESSTGGKGRLSRAVKGAIFREVVLAKVREMKEQEQTLKVKEEVEKEARRKSFNA